MKRICKNLIFLFTLIFTFNSIPVEILALSTSKNFNESNLKNWQSNTELLVSDSNSTTDLPTRFRIIPELKIAGGKQFTPAQLKNIQNKIKSDNLYIVDLREESHGFNDNNAISIYKKISNKNYPFTIESILNRETQKLNTLKNNSTLNIYNQKGNLVKTVNTGTIQSEAELVKQNNINYVRFPVIDGYIPSPEIVDEFVNFIKSKPEDSYLYFHCKEGQGRTTTFMSLYEMMNNKNNLSLDEILKHQKDIGGIDIVTGNTSRATFLKNFYNYTTENMEEDFKTPYSIWIKNK
ncbi:phosphatase [Clostridiaceae bacterium 14S0207]|nr:phosphatase [Clostridiaceae bacterium 14S0207]